MERFNYFEWSNYDPTLELTKYKLPTLDLLKDYGKLVSIDADEKGENKTVQTVSMQSVLASKKFQETSYDLPIALGKTITDEVFMVDLCKLPI